MAQRRAKSGRKKVSRPAAQYPEIVALLRPIVIFLSRSGIPHADLAKEFDAALRGATQGAKKISIRRIGKTHWCTEIVDRWLRDPAYLNAVGKPKDIPLHGKISVEALVKVASVSGAPRKAVKLMEEFGAIQKTSKGTYRLVRRYTYYTIPEALPYEPNVEFLIDAVAAATRGLGGKQKQSLFWLRAQNGDLPKRHIADFLAYVRQRGLVFLQEVDDWLEQHAEARSTSMSTSKKFGRLGIGLFPICADK